MALPLPLQIVLLIFVITFNYSKSIEIKWCHPESAKEQCKIISDNDSSYTCISAPNIFRCIEMVKDGTADILYVSDTELYPAGKNGLKPLLKIVHQNSTNYRYKAVAVVKKAGKVKSLEDLKKAKSCHTGAGKTTGWTVPVSNLMWMRRFDKVNCYSSAQFIGNLFMESCVPGAMTERFNPLNLNPPRLCKLCANQTVNCSPTDAYAGYDGAMKCLKNTDADIAFVKHETILHEDKSVFRLLCGDGQFRELDQYEICHWAVRPSDTIVISPKNKIPDDVAKKLVADFGKLKTAFDWEKAEGLNKTNRPFSMIMGEGFLRTFEWYHTCKEPVRWCVISDAELKKCTDLKYAFMAKRATNNLGCIKAKDHYECMSMIEQKKADFVVLDGGDVATAINNCKLEPVIAENYGFGTASYYAVAVVKKGANFNIKTLKGKKSCHTGIGKTSGWKVPVSYFIKNKMLPSGDSIPDQVGKFFTASCVPGALDKQYNPDGDNPKSLCALCPDNGANCQRNSENKYYDYSGALRCLVETDADVAFVKHTTVPESTDGNGKEEWEKDLKSANFNLLCKDGTLKPVSEWRDCHLAKVPAHAIVVRKDDTKFGDLLYRIFQNFDLSSKESQELLFSSPGGKNYLFKDSTKGLIHIEQPEKFLGADYLEIIKVFGKKLDICASGSSSVTASLILVIFTFLCYFTSF